MNLDVLHELIARVASVSEHNPEIRSLTLDPVVTTPDGVVITRASVHVGPPVSLGPRRLAAAI